MENIVLAQINFRVGDLAYNAKKVIDCILSNPGKIIVFAELAICGYPPEDLLFDQKFLNQVVAILSEISESCKINNTQIIIGAPVIDDNRLYNAVLYIASFGVQVVHKKIFLPNYGVFDEKRYFSEGSKILEVLNFNGNRVVCLVCEDLWCIEDFEYLKSLALDFVVAINASPFEKGKMQKRLERVSYVSETISKPVIYLNMLGGQDSVVFDGASFVYYPDKSVKTLAFCKEQIVEIGALKKQSHGVLSSDMGEISSIYNVICLGIRDYFKKNSQKKALVALSGGMDSALCSILAVDALGYDNVKVVTLPSKFTSQASFDDADYLVKKLNLDCLNISIEGVFNELLSSLNSAFSGYQADVTEENMQSRIRGLIMMSLSNKYNSLVITTGNKSEYACGYATIYGDMCGAIAPIKDVFKTDVYKLAHWRNNNVPLIADNSFKNMFSDSVLTKAPTAELRFDQKDSDSLPEYEVLDQFLKAVIEDKRDINSVKISGIESDTKVKIMQLLRIAEYKRRQSAIGIKVSSCSFDKDWRFPITNKYL